MSAPTYFVTGRIVPLAPRLARLDFEDGRAPKSMYLRLTMATDADVTLMGGQVVRLEVSLFSEEAVGVRPMG